MSNLKERVQQMIVKSSQHDQLHADLQRSQVKAAEIFPLKALKTQSNALPGQGSHSVHRLPYNGFPAAIAEDITCRVKAALYSHSFNLSTGDAVECNLLLAGKPNMPIRLKSTACGICC